MKVYTRTGDDGTTSLIGGGRVPKNHPRVEAYGDVDELISYLGVIIAESDLPAVPAVQAKCIHTNLLRIQKVLMLVAAHFATPAEGALKHMGSIDESEVDFLESEIDRMTAELPTLQSFILSGAPAQAAECQFARTLCRRAERSSLGVSAKDETVSENVVLGRKYLNRLSDYLFTLGRYFCLITHTPEEYWTTAQ